jgi:hypothetical protein
VVIDNPLERDARVLGSRHKILCNELAREAEIRFPVSYLRYPPFVNLTLRSLVATSPSSFRLMGISIQYHLFLTRWPRLCDTSLHRNRLGACSHSGIPEICRNPDPDPRVGPGASRVRASGRQEAVEYGDNVDFGQPVCQKIYTSPLGQLQIESER